MISQSWPSRTRQAQPSPLGLCITLLLRPSLHLPPYPLLPCSTAHSHRPFTLAQRSPKKPDPLNTGAPPIPTGHGPRPRMAHQFLPPLGTGPGLEEKGRQKGESGRGKPRDWKGGFWVGFPSRVKAERGVHRVTSCATRGLRPDFGGIKIKREWPETFPFLNLPIFRLGLVFPTKPGKFHFQKAPPGFSRREEQEQGRTCRYQAGARGAGGSDESDQMQSTQRGQSQAELGGAPHSHPRGSPPLYSREFHLAP